MKNKNLGLIYVLLAYVLWGALPLYWRMLGHVPATTVLTHRVFWSILFLGASLAFQKRLRTTFSEMRDKRVFLTRSLAALLVSINWLTYVWAMGHGLFIESGLGYYIAPLSSLVLAAVILREKLLKLQWFAVGIVVSGVALKVLFSGIIPWVALLLAISWSLYGTIKKASPADPVSSLFQEVLVAFPLIAALIIIVNPTALFTSYGTLTNFLLVLSGPITAVPILMLVYGLRYVPLSATAFVQFLTPCINLLVAAYMGQELLSSDYYAFGVIMLGIMVYLASFSGISFSIPWFRKRTLNVAT